MNESHPYFYRDENDELKKYFYCSLCGDKPFTQKEVDEGKLKFVAGDKHKMYYCPDCIKLHRFGEHPVSLVNMKPKEFKPKKQVAVPLTLSRLYEKIKEALKITKNKTTIFFATGQDGAIFCSEDNKGNIQTIIDDINSGKSSQVGLRKQSIPFRLINQIEVSNHVSGEIIYAFRNLTKANKEQFVKNLEENVRNWRTKTKPIKQSLVLTP